MIRLPDQILARYPRRARTELSAAWEHLLNAAQYGARQVGGSSRRRVAVARERAALARLALGGKPPTSRWRWAGVGLAAGVILGVVGAAAVARRLRDTDPTTPEQERADTATVGERVRTAAAAVREQTSAVVHDAAAAARATVDRVREKATGNDVARDTEPPSGPPKRTSSPED
jgi:hypothetical protein